jgi:hypothetical protein
MRSRTSWRTFSSSKLSENDRELIEEYIKKVSLTPFGNKPRFKLIDYDHGEQRIGT